MKKITFTIDNRQVEAFKGDNLLKVAREQGIDIPGLCYHPRISPTGACRLCVVYIEGYRGPVMACTVEVDEGMKVIAMNDELEQARRHTLEYLLSEINDAYDGTYEDELLPLIKRYGLEDVNKRAIKPLWHHLPSVKDDTSPVLMFDSQRCIKCFRCIKACDEIQGKKVLSFADRGITKYIVAGYGRWKDSECDGCGECIQLCPTGAIVEKPFRDVIRVDKIEKKVRTVCPYCGVGCQIEAWVMDNQIVRVRGVEGVSPNDGRLCVKGRFGYHYTQSEERLQKPLIKRNGQFVEVSWDEAFRYTATRLLEIKSAYGSKALAGYSSAKCTNEENYLFQKFVRIAFGNNNVDYCTRLCHASTVAAMIRAFGDGAGSNSIEDFENTDCLIVIGNNIIETHPVTATYVKRGAARGQKIIVIDPKWTPLVKYATLFLQPRLATDVALLNGMMYHIVVEGLVNYDFIESRVEGGLQAFEELKKVVMKYDPETVKRITGVEASLVRDAAVMYATAPTAMIATGMGMSQQTVGTNNVFALINLCLITGQIGRELCGINPPRGQNNVQGATDVGASPYLYPGYIPLSDEENRRRVAQIWNVSYETLNAEPGLTTLEIMDAAYDGRIKALYIMGENPVITDPDQHHTIEALKKLEFLIVQDIFMTETAQYADVVLPAASLFEKEGTVVNSDRRVLRIRKVLEPPGEALPDWQILMQLAQYMNLSIGNYQTAEDIFEEIRQAAPIFRGMTYKRIDYHGIQWPCYDEQHPGTRTLYLERFSTVSGKAKIHPVEYTEQSELPNDQYPLVLNTGRLLYQYHSATMTRKSETLNAYINHAYIMIHPDDAVKYGIQDGDQVRVISPRGVIETIAVVTDQVLPGETFMPWHFHETPVNSLTRNEKDPISKIAPFKYSVVRVEKV